MSTPDTKEIMQKVEDLQAQLEKYEASQANGTDTVEELKSLIDETRALSDVVSNHPNPAVQLIGLLMDAIPLPDFENLYAEMTGNKTTKQWKNGKFDLFTDTFIADCQAYFEDIALNASKKSKKALEEAAQVVKGLPEDFEGLNAENPEEKAFLENLPGQTRLLEKIIERQLTLKEKPKAPKAKTPKEKAPVRKTRV